MPSNFDRENRAKRQPIAFLRLGSRVRQGRALALRCLLLARRSEAGRRDERQAVRHGASAPQLKHFALEEALGERGWLTALALDGYAARSRGKPEALQQALFSYLEAL